LYRLCLFPGVAMWVALGGGGGPSRKVVTVVFPDGED